jgi:hypothetical protein
VMSAGMKNRPPSSVCTKIRRPILQ